MIPNWSPRSGICVDALPGNAPESGIVPRGLRFDLPVNVDKGVWFFS